MSKKILFFIAIAVLIVVFVVGVVFFGKKNIGPIYNQPANPSVNKPIAPSEKPLSEEEKLKIMAMNFAGTYDTYKLEDFSNIEALSEKMTSGLWDEKSKWIEAEKEKLKNQPKLYIAYSAHCDKANFTLFNDQEAEATVDCIKTETRGAMIQGETTIKYVNEFGEEKPAPPPTETSKKIYLKMIKVDNDWKVDRIENMNKN